MNFTKKMSKTITGWTLLVPAYEDMKGKYVVLELRLSDFDADIEQRECIQIGLGNNKADIEILDKIYNDIKAALDGKKIERGKFALNKKIVGPPEKPEGGYG